ncbi:MAG TPA: GntR family transcriptional regulator [Clostridiaceae bacterium]|nr:GntR family transcriptional regulator [Clostridiaceae bacterium]
MLNPNAPKPLYIQLKEKIKNAIESGEWKPDTQIPSERDLCNKYNVSRITVRQAISEAQKEGLLYKIQGKGTYVKTPKIEQGLMKITSFGSTLKSRGLNGRTEVLTAEIVPVDFQISNILNIDMTENVVNLGLLGLANDEPIVYYNSYFTYDIGIKMIDAAKKHAKEGRPFSTYDLYKELNIPADTVSQTFEATNCDKETAKILKLKQGTALFVIVSVVYLNDGRPVEFKTAMYRADKYKFHIKRSM